MLNTEELAIFRTSGYLRHDLPILETVQSTEMAAFWSMPSAFSPPNQIAPKAFIPLTAVSHTLAMYNQADQQSQREG